MSFKPIIRVLYILAAVHLLVSCGGGGGGGGEVTPTPDVNMPDEGPPTVVGDRYERLDENGDALADTDTTDHICVRNTTRGLVWEVKNTDGADEPRDVDKLYGLAAGVGSVGSVPEYLALLNEQKLCGFGNWRLPSPHEAYGLINGKSSTAGEYKVLIDKFYFPDIHRGIEKDKGDDYMYWTEGKVYFDYDVYTKFTPADNTPVQAFTFTLPTAVVSENNGVKINTVLYPNGRKLRVRAVSPEPQ